MWVKQVSQIIYASALNKQNLHSHLDTNIKQF